MIKYIYDNEADIPADVKGQYTKTGEGKWQLQVEGAVPESFRSNNLTLMRERDEMKGRIKPLVEAGLAEEDGTAVVETITTYKRLKGIEDQLADQKLIKMDKVDEVVAKRTATMKADHEKEILRRDTEIKKRDEELAVIKIDQTITAELTKQRVRPEAIEDMVRRGREKFKLEGGKVIAYKNVNGALEKDYSSKNGSETLSIAEWAEGLPSAAAYAFQESTGSGSGGGGGGQGGGDLAHLGNPWKKGTPQYHLGNQATILKKNPTLATRLKAEAGAK